MRIGGTNSCSSAKSNQVFSTVKKYFILNILSFQMKRQYILLQRKCIVEVDPLILRQAAIEFQVADGLFLQIKLMNIDSWASICR